MFKLFQQCHGSLYAVSCLPLLDWKAYLNLDAFLKLFRCTKRDVCRVLVTSLRNIPTILLKEKVLHDEVVDNLHKFKSVEVNLAVTTVTCSDIYSAYLLFIFRLSSG